MLQPRLLMCLTYLALSSIFLMCSMVEGVALKSKSRSSAPVPDIEVFEFKSETVNPEDLITDQRSTVLVNTTRNSDLLFGEVTERDSKLLLKCQASYAVQWVFRGDSNPEFSTNSTTTSESAEEMGDQGISYIAYLFLGMRRNLDERETGKYICTSVREKKLQSYVYIFVTKAALFTAKGSETIYYTDNDASVRIPCSLSEPRAVATLQKSQDGMLKCPLNETVRFEPKQGFILSTKLDNPDGTYLCIADYNNTFQIIKYHVAKSNSSNSEQTSEETEEQTGASEFETTPHPIQVTSSTPIPTGDSGGTSDNETVNNCSNVTCGNNAFCLKNKNGTSVCKCYDGYIGNPYVGCKHKSETTTDLPQHQEHPPSLNDHCYSNYDCPQDEACIRNSCHDPCRVQSICGPNTYCNETSNHTPICKCKEGFVGDPYSSQETQKCESIHCNPNPCGENTICHYSNGIISCSCKPGYATYHDNVCRPKRIGAPSNVAFHPHPTKFTTTTVTSVSKSTKTPTQSYPHRKECRFDIDCPDNRMCVHDSCQDPCVNACGGGAVCRTLNHFPRCHCPEGTTGDPFYKCAKLFSEVLGSTTPTVASMTLDCGTKDSICGPNTICQASGQYFVCICPNNFVGDPYSPTGCSKEGGYEKCEKDNDCHHFHSCLRNKGCINPCDVDDVCKPGTSCVPHLHQPYCLKTANDIVNKPRDDLTSNSQDDTELIPTGVSNSSCFQKSGDTFSSPCGKNSVCYDVNNGYFCGCMANFIGDAYTSCEPIQVCEKESDCGANAACQNGVCREILEHTMETNMTNPCYPSPCMNENEKCVILSSNNSAICMSQEDGFKIVSSEVHRLDACDLNGNCDEVEDETDMGENTTASVGDATEDNYSFTNVPYVDAYNSNETTSLSHDDYAVEDV